MCENPILGRALIDHQRKDILQFRRRELWAIEREQPRRSRVMRRNGAVGSVRDGLPCCRRGVWLAAQHARNAMPEPSIDETRKALNDLVVRARLVP